MKDARLTPGAHFRPIRSLLYYAQRIVTPPRIRRLVILTLRCLIRMRQGGVPLPPTQGASDDLRRLRRDGLVPFAAILSSAQCQQIGAYLRDKQMTDRLNVDNVFKLDGVPRSVRMSDYAMADVLQCPHILDVVNHPALIALATSYLGCKPTISQVAIRRAFPSDTAAVSVQRFHRDAEDWRYVKLIVFLSDVDREGGPHFFVLGSHLEQAPLRLKSHSDADIVASHGAHAIAEVTGPSGFGFVIDSAGIHKGASPTKHRRLMLQIQYSMCEGYAHEYTPVDHPDTHRFDGYINRLILKKIPRDKHCA